MEPNPLSGVVLDKLWVQRFERVEASWSVYSHALGHLERLADIREVLCAVTLIPDTPTGTSVQLHFEDGTVVTCGGVGAPDAAALAEFVATEGNVIVLHASPEPVASGWRLRLRLTGPSLGPLTLVLDAASLA